MFFQRFKFTFLITLLFLVNFTITCKQVSEVSKNRSAYKGLVDSSSIRVARPAFTKFLILEFTASQPIDCEIKFAPLEEELVETTDIKCAGKPFGDKYLYNYTINDSDPFKRYHFKIIVWKKGFSRPTFPENYDYSEEAISSWMTSSYTLKTNINLDYLITQSGIINKEINDEDDGCTDSTSNYKLSSTFTESIAPISFKGYFNGSSTTNDFFTSHAGRGHLDNIQSDTELLSSFMETPISHKIKSLDIKSFPIITSGSISKELIEVEKSTESNSVSIKKDNGISISLDANFLENISKATFQIGSPGHLGYKICKLSKSTPSIKIKDKDLDHFDNENLIPVLLTIHKLDTIPLKTKPLDKWQVWQSKSFITNINLL